VILVYFIYFCYFYIAFHSLPFVKAKKKKNALPFVLYSEVSVVVVAVFTRYQNFKG